MPWEQLRDKTPMSVVLTQLQPTNGEGISEQTAGIAVLLHSVPEGQSIVAQGSEYTHVVTPSPL